MAGEADPTWWTCSSALGSPAMNDEARSTALSLSAAQPVERTDHGRRQETEQQPRRQDRLLVDRPHPAIAISPTTQEMTSSPGRAPARSTVPDRIAMPGGEQGADRQHQGRHHPALDPLDLHREPPGSLERGEDGLGGDRGAGRAATLVLAVDEDRRASPLTSSFDIWSVALTTHWW